MSNLKDIKRVYFLGIGGIGMSALARYFLSHNILVSGYDRSRSEICLSLEADSCKIIYQDSPSQIPSAFLELKDTLVVYTPAISSRNRLFAYFSDKNFLLSKRSQVLGEITKDFYCLAIAGTHGKTTISSMLAYILHYNSIDCWAFLGGIATDFNSNFLGGSTSSVVVEADEFDRSFLKLHPNWALISSMDSDHLDIYGAQSNLEASFNEFIKRTENKQIIAREDLKISSMYTYALNSDTADFSATNIKVIDGIYYFDIIYPGGFCKGIQHRIKGIHNIENAIGAFSMAFNQGISIEGITRALSSFSGVKRRFEYHINKKNKVYIDDYAHHPKEIELCIKSVRELFPDKSLTIVFQPHLFTRTRDFMNQFAEALSAADRVMLLDIYPARELPIEGVNSKVLLSHISCVQKGLYKKESIVEFLSDIEILLTLGAGDISDLVNPIKTHLLS
tara:strand:+ start:358 stop:1704 length:1347 start_codon:yes stop_codon:yes gene_type:complete